MEGPNLASEQISKGLNLDFGNEDYATDDYDDGDDDNLVYNVFDIFLHTFRWLRTILFYVQIGLFLDFGGNLFYIPFYIFLHFSCAAQQLNASQSTHRFSFVNHTIKTVNMPKVRHSVNLKSKLTSYISEFKEDGLSTDNKILFCNLCQCAVSSTQKFLVQQHITTSKHQANKQLNSKQRQLFLTQPTTSNVRSEFNIDLCRSLISADIPLYKLKNKVFREFLEKYTQHTIPDESTLRKTYAPSIYDETIQKIRDEIKDSSIWVSIDETPDKEGRLVGNVVIGLLSEQYSERILLHCDVLEKCNNKTIVKLFNEAMGILWPKGIMYDNVLFFISDAAPYMVKAGQALSVVYPKLTHFTCVAHAFHRVAEVVRDNFLK
ncbi:hypothetical protein ANN_09882 [Periplaneta americana]|uniref:DUF659 domain-containing protein n=1 Tax=Periplaneta americana TaxID=6978 RepID=A0ABQ8TPU2_PERAM|nr:hypothetical protein ANN_09882 [Periplaneta americana]